MEEDIKLIYLTSDGPTNQSKKGTVNAALNSAAHFVGGNNFLNCRRRALKRYCLVEKGN